MPVPLAPPVRWAHDEPSRLASIVRAPSTPQALAFRCQFIRRVAAPDRPAHLPVAHELPWHRPPGGRWRHRSLAPGLTGLQEAPRSGRPRRFSPRSASGGDGDGHPSTRDVPLRRHPLAARRPGGRSGAGAPLDQESLPPLAPSGCGRPPTPAPGRWAPPPRSGLRAPSARPVCLLAPGPALLRAWSLGSRHR
jgi:hypothetical protein